MQISPTLLASLTSVAGGVAHSAAEAMQPIGAGFIEALRSLTGSDNSDYGVGSVGNTPGSASVQPDGETLDGLVGRFRDWLRKSGAKGELDIQFTVDQFDRVHFRAFGETAEQMELLLKSNPQWLDQMREAAIDHRVRENTIPGSNVQTAVFKPTGHDQNRSEVEIHVTTDEATIRWR